MFTIGDYADAYVGAQPAGIYTMFTPVVYVYEDGAIGASWADSQSCTYVGDNGDPTRWPEDLVDRGDDHDRNAGDILDDRLREIRSLLDTITEGWVGPEGSDIEVVWRGAQHLAQLVKPFFEEEA